MDQIPRSLVAPKRGGGHTEPRPRRPAGWQHRAAAGWIASRACSRLSTACGPPARRCRTYISCVLGCPYEGPVSFERVASLAGRLHELGCEEIALGDTHRGGGTPLAACWVAEATAYRLPARAHHRALHDTRGQALANLLACLGLGVSPSSTPRSRGWAAATMRPGASGNVAIEDVAYCPGLPLHLPQGRRGH
jgi:hypothetical protein